MEGEVVIAIGIDCGSDKTGFACIEMTAAGVRLTAAAHEPIEWLRPARADAVYAIEQIQGYAFNPARVKHLVETARNEGRALEMLHNRDVVVFTAREARGEFCRTPRASDNQVRIVVESLVTIVPKLKAATRVHVYDAALVALLALRRRGHALKLPNDAEVRLLSLQALENEKRTAKRKAVA